MTDNTALAKELEALAGNILNENLGYVAWKMKNAAEALRNPAPAPVGGEPVAWMYEWKPWNIDNSWQTSVGLEDPRIKGLREYRNVVPLYAHPQHPAPQTVEEWQDLNGLSRDEMPNGPAPTSDEVRALVKEGNKRGTYDTSKVGPELIAFLDDRAGMLEGLRDEMSEGYRSWLDDAVRALLVARDRLAERLASQPTAQPSEDQVARAIAKANGDEFANAFKNKRRWTAKRGMSGGRFRDVNEPFQSDYLDMARAAIAAMQGDAAQADQRAMATADKLARRMGGRFVPRDQQPTAQPSDLVGRVAFAIIEGSAGTRAAEHAKEFQTANWTDACRSARAALAAMQGGDAVLAERER